MPEPYTHARTHTLMRRALESHRTTAAEGILS